MRFIFGLLLLTLTGCGSLCAANPSPRPAEELSTEVRSSLACPASYSFTKLETQHEKETWAVESDNFSMHYQYIRSLGSRPKDLVIIFNILKDKHQTVSGWLASNLTAMNYDCLIDYYNRFEKNKLGQGLSSNTFVCYN